MNNKCWYKDVCDRCDSDYCNRDCIRYYKMKYLLDASLLPASEQYIIKLVADEDDRNAYLELKSIQTDIEKVVEEGRNVLIYSKIPGNGKTSWAKKLMFTYFDAIWHKCDMEPKALFINVPRMFNELRSNIDKKSEYITSIKDNVLKADLVVWDEIGVKELTNFEHDNLLSFVDQRILSNKSNIFTSNLSEDELLPVLGDRLYSRIVNTSKVIQFKGRDKRALNKW